MKKIIDTQMKNTQVKVFTTAKKQAFENLTLLQFSQFERVLIKTTTLDEMNTKTTLAVHRVDLVLDKERHREREERRKKQKQKRRNRRQAVSK
jgi:hypothetical protein